MDSEAKIDSRPSIKVLVSDGKQKGRLHLSSLYGSYKVHEPFDIKKGSIASFFCPYCKKELKGHRVCEKCGAPMIPLALQEGGLVQICSRRGCKKHLIEFEDPEAEIGAFYATYSTFVR
ncbi:MAG: hypothetical protein WC728_02225 [Elusimicrobiota bacterium]